MWVCYLSVLRQDSHVAIPYALYNSFGTSWDRYARNGLVSFAMHAPLLGFSPCRLGSNKPSESETGYVRFNCFNSRMFIFDS